MAILGPNMYNGLYLEFILIIYYHFSHMHGEQKMHRYFTYSVPRILRATSVNKPLPLRADRRAEQARAIQALPTSPTCNHYLSGIGNKIVTEKLHSFSIVTIDFRL